MKKGILIVNLLLISSIFFGCTDFSNLAIPKKATIKMNPTYEFNLGNIEKDLSEQLNLKNLVHDGIASVGIVDFDYNPGENSSDLQQILLKKTIQEIPVNMDQYFKNSTLTSQLEGFSFSQEIEIPEIDYEKDETVDLKDLNDQLLDLIIIGGFTNGGELNVDMGENGSTETFETMSFDEGSLVITTQNEYSGNTVTILHNGEPLVSAPIYGKRAELDLAGVTLYRDGMTVDFAPKRDFTVFVGKIESGKINKVTGLTLDGIKTPLNSTVDTSSAFDDFETCIIKEGDVRFTMTAWNGITIDFPITLSGGISGKSEASGKNGQKVDLAGKSVAPEETTFTSNIKISCKKGTIDFTNPPVIKTEIDIREIESITVTMDEIEPIEDKISLPGEFMTTVKQIDFGKSVIPLVYTNTLPAGNAAISINFYSNFLGIDESQDLQRTEQSIVEFKAKSESKVCYIVENPTEEDQYNAIDYKIDVKLPGADADNPQLITLKNVKPGDKYKIECKIDSEKMDFAWNKILLNTSDYAQKETIDTGLDIASISSSLGDFIDGIGDAKLNIENFDFYLFATKPNLEAFNNAKFSGTTSIYTNKDDESKCKYMLGSKDSSGEMAFSDLPAFEKNAEGVVVTDIKNFNPSCHVNLADIFNNSSEGETLCVDYDLSFTTGAGTNELVITPEMLDSKTQNVVIVAYMVYPAKLCFSEDVTINVSSILFSEDTTDMLGRDGPSSDGDSLLDAIKSVSLAYECLKLPFNGDMQFEINLYGENDDIHKETMPISKGSIDITSVGDLMNVYPLVPSIKIVIPATKGGESNYISLPRETILKTKMSVKIEADKEIEIKMPFGGN